ncbi:MAG: GC-type dockerin domain-anchored protein [Planctomycetota bacterium]
MNTHARIAAIGLWSLLPLAGGAWGQSAELTVDPAQSTITVVVELVTPLGNRTSQDTSPIQGTASIEIDDADAPASITLSTYSFTSQDDLTFSLDYSFLGAVSGVGSGLGLRQPMGSPPTTGPVDGAGAFTLLGVPNENVGTVDASGTGTVGSAIGMVSIDLATLGQAFVDAPGTVAIVGDQATVTVSVPISATEELQPGVTANITGSASVVATGTLIDPCPADTNGDGLATPQDFTAWIQAFNARSAACDQNGDGLCTPQDFTSWVVNFNAGC